MRGTRQIDRPRDLANDSAMSRYLSPTETSRVLGVSLGRLRQPDMEKRLQPDRIGTRRVYREDSVARELDRRIDDALARREGSR